MISFSDSFKCGQGTILMQYPHMGASSSSWSPGWVRRHPSEDRHKTERQSEMEIWVRNFIHVHVMSLRRLVSLVQYDDTRGEETSTSPASHSVLLGNGTRRNTSRAGLTYVSKTSRPPLCHVKVGGWRQHCTVSSHQGAIEMRLSSACITSRNGEWSRVLA